MGARTVGLRKSHLAIAAIHILTMVAFASAASAKIGLLDRASDKMGAWVEEYKPLEKSANTVKEFVSQIAVALPVLQEMGFEVDSFRTQLLPPMVQIRIISRDTLVAASASTKVALPEDAPVIAKSIVISAESARELQQLMKLSGIVMDIGLGLKPSIKMSFMTGDDNMAGNGTRFNDLDLLCGAALD